MAGPWRYGDVYAGTPTRARSSSPGIRLASGSSSALSSRGFAMTKRAVRPLRRTA